MFIQNQSRTNNNMKLKEPNNNRKHFILPHIKNFQPNRFTPRKINNNRSLPKIPSSYVEQSQENSVVHLYKQGHQDKQKLKEKLRMIYKRKNNIALNCLETEPNTNEIDESGLTNQFQREIEKNLMLIKRERLQKENKRNNNNVNRLRYNSPPPIAVSTDQLTTQHKKTSRCATEEDVFAKINDIITNSQSKSALLIEDTRNVSYSTVVNNNSYHKRGNEYRKSRKRMKTDSHQTSQLAVFSQIKQNPIKHEGNYSEWRKVSIDSAENGCIKYDASSYQKETDRLEKIRSKNDLSLKKYFQGKSYLNKLINYRESTSILSKKE